MKKFFYLMVSMVAMCTMFACGNAKVSEESEEAATDTVMVEEAEVVEADSLAVDTLVAE